MTAVIWTVIASLFQLALLILQAYLSHKAEVSKAKLEKTKEISDAVNSGDVSRINSTINGLRS